MLFERHAVGGEYGAGWKPTGAGRLATIFTPIDPKGEIVVVDDRYMQDQNNVAVTYHNPLDNVPDLAHHFFSVGFPTPPPSCTCLRFLELRGLVGRRLEVVVAAARRCLCIISRGFGICAWGVNVGCNCLWCPQRCLEVGVTPYVVTKKTVFKWQESFWVAMSEVFEKYYKAKFEVAPPSKELSP